MEPIVKSEYLDTYDDKYETDDICPKSGHWICKDHPAIKKLVKQDDYFPKCHQGGHKTIWHRIMNKNEF